MSAGLTWMAEAAVLWIVFMNIAAFAAFSADKRRAVRGKWRIPESRLFALALLGGAAGSLAAMHLCRHKIRERRFAAGIPLILVLQLGILAGLAWTLCAR